MTPKTYKREVAGILLLFLGGLFVYGIYTPTGQATDTAKYLTTPIFLYVTGAFGIDAVMKQRK